jgi:hypothetical protein
MCHRTQHGLFIRHGSQEAGRPVSVPEMVRATESVHRVHPLVPARTPVSDAFADLLRASGLARENPAWLG